MLKKLLWNSVSLNIYYRDRAGVLNEYDFISKLLPLFFPECNKTVFCNEIYPSGFRKFVNLILLFISFLFSYPCALDVSVFFPLRFLDVTRNRRVVLADGGWGGGASM